MGSVQSADDSNLEDTKLDRFLQVLAPPDRQGCITVQRTSSLHSNNSNQRKRKSTRSVEPCASQSQQTVASIAESDCSSNSSSGSCSTGSSSVGDHIADILLKRLDEGKNVDDEVSNTELSPDAVSCVPSGLDSYYGREKSCSGVDCDDQAVSDSKGKGGSQNLGICDYFNYGESLEAACEREREERRKAAQCDDGKQKCADDEECSKYLRKNDECDEKKKKEEDVCKENVEGKRDDVCECEQEANKCEQEVGDDEACEEDEDDDECDEEDDDDEDDDECDDDDDDEEEDDDDCDEDDDDDNEECECDDDGDDNDDCEEDDDEEEKECDDEDDDDEDECDDDDDDDECEDEAENDENEKDDKVCSSGTAKKDENGKDRKNKKDDEKNKKCIVVISRCDSGDSEKEEEEEEEDDDEEEEEEEEEDEEVEGTQKIPADDNRKPCPTASIQVNRRSMPHVDEDDDDDDDEDEEDDDDDDEEEDEEEDECRGNKENDEDDDDDDDDDEDDEEIIITNEDYREHEKSDLDDLDEDEKIRLEDAGILVGKRAMARIDTKYKSYGGGKFDLYEKGDCSGYFSKDSDASDYAIELSEDGSSEKPNKGGSFDNKGVLTPPFADKNEKAKSKQIKVYFGDDFKGNDKLKPEYYVEGTKTEVGMSHPTKGIDQSYFDEAGDRGKRKPEADMESGLRDDVADRSWRREKPKQSENVQVQDKEDGFYFCPRMSRGGGNLNIPDKTVSSEARDYGRASSEEYTGQNKSWRNGKVAEDRNRGDVDSHYFSGEVARRNRRVQAWINENISDGLYRDKYTSSNQGMEKTHQDKPGEKDLYFTSAYPNIEGKKVKSISHAEGDAHYTPEHKKSDEKSEPYSGSYDNYTTTASREITDSSKHERRKDKHRPGKIERKPKDYSKAYDFSRSIHLGELETDVRAKGSKIERSLRLKESNENGGLYYDVIDADAFESVHGKTVVLCYHENETYKENAVQSRNGKQTGRSPYYSSSPIKQQSEVCKCLKFEESMRTYFVDERVVRGVKSPERYGLRNDRGICNGRCCYYFENGKLQPKTSTSKRSPTNEEQERNKYFYSAKESNNYLSKSGMLRDEPKIGYSGIRSNSPNFLLSQRDGTWYAAGSYKRPDDTEKISPTPKALPSKPVYSGAKNDYKPLYHPPKLDRDAKRDRSIQSNQPTNQNTMKTKVKLERGRGDGHDAPVSKQIEKKKTKSLNTTKKKHKDTAENIKMAESIVTQKPPKEYPSFRIRSSRQSKRKLEIIPGFESPSIDTKRIPDHKNTQAPSEAIKKSQQSWRKVDKPDPNTEASDYRIKILYPVEGEKLGKPGRKLEISRLDKDTGKSKLYSGKEILEHRETLVSEQDIKPYGALSPFDTSPKEDVLILRDGERPNQNQSIGGSIPQEDKSTYARAPYFYERSDLKLPKPERIIIHEQNPQVDSSSSERLPNQQYKDFQTEGTGLSERSKNNQKEEEIHQNTSKNISEDEGQKTKVSASSNLETDDSKKSNEDLREMCLSALKQRLLDQIKTNKSLDERPSCITDRMSIEESKESADDVKESADEVKESADEVKESADEVKGSGDDVKESADDKNEKVEIIKSPIEYENEAKLKESALNYAELSPFAYPQKPPAVEDNDKTPSPPNEQDRECVRSWAHGIEKIKISRRKHEKSATQRKIAARKKSFPCAGKEPDYVMDISKSPPRKYSVVSGKEKIFPQNSDTSRFKLVLASDMKKSANSTSTIRKKADDVKQMPRENKPSEEAKKPSTGCVRRRNTSPKNSSDTSPKRRSVSGQRGSKSRVKKTSGRQGKWSAISPRKLGTAAGKKISPQNWIYGRSSRSTTPLGAETPRNYTTQHYQLYSPCEDSSKPNQDEIKDTQRQRPLAQKPPTTATKIKGSTTTVGSGSSNSKDDIVLDIERIKPYPPGVNIIRVDKQQANPAAHSQSQRAYLRRSGDGRVGRSPSRGNEKYTKKPSKLNGIWLRSLHSRKPSESPNSNSFKVDVDGVNTINTTHKIIVTSKNDEEDNSKNIVNLVAGVSETSSPKNCAFMGAGECMAPREDDDGVGSVVETKNFYHRGFEYRDYESPWSVERYSDDTSGDLEYSSHDSGSHFIDQIKTRASPNNIPVHELEASRGGSNEIMAKPEIHPERKQLKFEKDPSNFAQQDEFTNYGQYRKSRSIHRKE